MSGKAESNQNFTDQGKPKVNVRRLLIGAAALLLAGLCIGGYFLLGTGAGVFSSDARVTVTFNSTGGSEVASQTIRRGETLAGTASPARGGYVFAGWYYEEAPVNRYDANDVFLEDTTLYAGWYEPVMEVDNAEYLHSCGSDVSFVVASETPLTQDNLAAFVGFTALGPDDGAALSVKAQDGGFLLYAPGGFTPGVTYTIALLDTQTTAFVQADGEDVAGLGVTSYSFTVFRENENNVVKKADVKLLSAADMLSFESAGKVTEADNELDVGKDIYRVELAGGDYQAGDIVSIGDGDTDARDNQYYRVIKAAASGSRLYLDVIVPNMDEIYAEYSVYYSGEAATYEDAGEDLEELEKSLQTSLKESEGYDYLCTAIARGIKDSPTLQSTVSKLDINSQKRFERVSVNALADMLKNVRVDLAFQKTYDIAGQENGTRGIVSFTTGNITIKLDEKVDLTIKLTMTEDLTSLATGYTIIKDWKVYTNQGINLYNDFTTEFSVEVKTNSHTLNITDEIQKLVNSQSDDKTTEIVNSLNNEDLFGDDLDYVQILSKRLGDKTITIYEVLSIQFTLDFNVSVGMRAGLVLNFHSHEVRAIGMYNIDYSSSQLKKTDMHYYNERLMSKVEFSATLKGQIGVRAGFAAGVNFSVVHLNDVFNFGFAAELGVYEELSGFLKFTYANTTLNTSGQHSSDTSFSLAGGLKSETGIYLELSFTWNVFGFDGSVTLAEFKFPILTIGSLEFASEFEKPEQDVTFNTVSYNIPSGGDGKLLNLKHVDISAGKGGVTVNIKPSSTSGDYAYFLMKDDRGIGTANDLKYVSVGRDTGMLAVKDGAPERLDFMVVVQYTKGCSLFTKDLTPITKKLHFTYMKVQVGDSAKKYKASFYRPDGVLLEAKDYFVGQIPVAPASSTYDLWLATSKYKMKNWAKPWKEDIKAIYADTDYHMDWEENNRTITYYGSVYDDSAGYSRTGVLAAVSSPVGELPVAPTADEVNGKSEWCWKFDGWYPALKKVDSDNNYYATYRQAGDACMTNFYIGSRRIWGGFVKKGTVPEAPDMAAYETDTSKFIGWWPSLHASNDNSELYVAMFADCVTMTFDAGEHEFADGTRVKTFKGTVRDYVELPQVTYRDKENTYTVDYWQSTETVDGAYIKLPMSRVNASCQYGLKFKPVFKSERTEYTVRFVGGDEFLTLTGYYGDVITADMLSGLKLTSRIPNYTYKLRDYGLTLPYKFGTKIGSDGYPVERFDARVSFDAVGVDKTFTFDANGGQFADGAAVKKLTAPYGTRLSFKDAPERAADSTYTYAFAGWADDRDAVSGASFDDFVINGDSTVYAVYRRTPRYVTLTFKAGAGHFTDAATEKTLRIDYGSAAPAFTLTPVRDSTAATVYTFSGWSPAYVPGVRMEADAVYTAQYTGAPREYAVTFNAGSGTFAGGLTVINQTYHYNDLIIPPASPARAATADYTYLFAGWSPALTAGARVSESGSYTAVFREIPRGDTGIIVSNGTDFEDISAGGIDGYTYAPDPTTLVPTLTVTGNGLAFSGASGVVCISIAPDVTDVTLSGLALSGAYTDVNGLLVVQEMSGPETELTIRIEGNCALTNTANGWPGVRIERPVTVRGSGTGPVLSVSTRGEPTALYCDHALTVDSLALNITALSNTEDAELVVSPLGGEASGGDWLFRDSDVTLNSQGAGCNMLADIKLDDSDLTVVSRIGMRIGNLIVSGASGVDIATGGENEAALVTATLLFEDFDGEFDVRGTHAAAPGIAVKAFAGIVFKEGGTELADIGGYDLHGALIDTFTDGAAGSYIGFGSGSPPAPATAVTVTKRP